jgi:hypothetical protein
LPPRYRLSRNFRACVSIGTYSDSIGSYTRRLIEVRNGTFAKALDRWRVTVALEKGGGRLREEHLPRLDDLGEP